MKAQKTSAERPYHNDNNDNDIVKYELLIVRTEKAPV